MEVNGRKVKMSIWVRPLIPPSLLHVANCLLSVSCLCCIHAHTHTRTCRTRRVKNASAPSRRRTTVARKASSSVRGRFTPFPSPYLSALRDPFPPPSRVHAMRACVRFANTIYIVYDVSNRESFEALPRWLEELENYVPPEVVKIVVGNKLDKVK